MREHGVPQFTVDAHRPVARVRRVRRLASPPSWATPTCSPRSTWPASRCTPPTATDADPIVRRRRARRVQPGADRRLHRRRRARRRRGGGAGDHRRSSGSGRPRARPGGRDELLLRLARTESVYVPRFYDVDYLPDGRIQRVVPNRAGRAVPGAQAHDDGPGRLAVPEEAAGPAGRDGARAVRGGDLPGLHPRLPVLPGRHDHPPGPGALDHHGRRRWSQRRAGVLRLRRGRPAVAVSAPTTPRSATCAPGLAEQYEGTNVSLSLPSTRVDAFNIDLAQELSRNGRRTGLTFAPEGGSERIRKVINKMVTEGGPDPHRRHRVHQRLAAGEALLHVRPAHRDRRGRAARSPDWRTR